MKNLIVFILTLLSVNFSNSQWRKKIKGNGNTIKINRTTQEYNAINVSGWYNVEIVDGKEGNIILKGEENLLEHIETKVQNGNLVIKTKNGINLKSSWNKGITIIVPVETIIAVSLAGSGDIIGKKTIKTDNFSTSMTGSGDITLTIEAKSVKANMSGSGDINLNGLTSNFSANLSGSGDIKAYALKADNVNAVVSGSANIKVSVKEQIKARVSGSGDISYRGNPTKVDTKTSGSGNISKG